MKQLTNALSNEVWINDENMIEKRYSSDEFKKTFGNQEQIVLNKLNIKNELKDNILFIEYIDHESFNDEEITNDDLVNVAKAINNLHSLPTEGMELSKFEKVYNEFLSEDVSTDDMPIDGTEVELADAAFDILESGEQVVLHNDVVEGNLLKVDDEIKLIDFEYSGLGNKIFDIASFLTERELTKEQHDTFVNQFEGIDLEELRIVSAFLQIFWTRWALFKFRTTEKEIYKIIAEWKYEQYLKIK